MKHLRTRHILPALFTLCLGLLHAAPARSSGVDNTSLISTAEFHLVGRSLNYLPPDDPDPLSEYGFDVGIQIADYTAISMFGGLNGVEFSLRMGYYDALSLQTRIASLWTVLGTPNLNLSIGPGGELFMIIESETLTDVNYIQPLLSLRMGLGLGVLSLRTEYDYHLIRGAHHLRGYLPLFDTVGLGLELGFDRTLSDTLALNNAGALLLFRF